MAETESTQAESSAAVTETETTTATDATEVTGASSTEDVNSTDKPHMIPKSRLDEVIGERNTLRQEKQAFEERMAALEAKLAPKDEPTAKGKLPEPPAELTDQREIIDWYVQEGAQRLIESKLGMDLDTAKTLLVGSKAAIQKSTEQQWKDACATHKLDPSDVMVQATVMGLVQGSKMDFGDAMKQTAKRFGQASNGKKDVATVPDGTQSGVMTQSDRQPKTKEEAA
ncbi:MAG TPA: hypothetical protein VM118_10390, partial [Acidobacteriota bacterium]|nr:hypothetical protein [Acidobacteriota bacterium]